jgi:hypothetical protein
LAFEAFAIEAYAIFNLSAAFVLPPSREAEFGVAILILIYPHGVKRVASELKRHRAGLARPVEVVKINNDLAAAILPAPVVNDCPLSFQSSD